MPQLKNKETHNFEKPPLLAPNILLPGGVVEVRFPFNIEPFLYDENDFRINKSPIRLIALSNNTLIGEVVFPLAEKSEFTYAKGETVICTQKVNVPQIVVTGYHQLESSPAMDSNGCLYFIDTMKSKDLNNNSVIYKWNPISDGVEKWISNLKHINAITVDNNDNVYATNNIDTNLYKLESTGNLTVVARGLGSPFGLTRYKNSIIIGDQDGSLFRVDENSSDAQFLTEIPIAFKGYYLACSKEGDIFISIPSNSGKNKILCFTHKKKLVTFLETFHMVGDISISPKGTVYWVENTRSQSILYRFVNGKKQRVASGSFFTGLFFNTDGSLYINDLHTIYKIKEEWIHD